MKNQAWSKRLPAGRDGGWDYIVIGSGMGGMTAAALLAKLGKKVLVLEQHYVAGGFTHMFNRPGYSWDVGVHAVGEVTAKSMTGRVLRELSNDKLHWASLGEVYDEFYFPDDFRIDFPNSPQAFRENLCNAFPNDRRAIDAYLGRVREVSQGMKRYYLARTAPVSVGAWSERLLAKGARSEFLKTTKDVVSSLTDNEKLRSIFTAQWGYYGSVPSRSSFAIQALVVKHFQWGGYYPVGGSKQIASSLLRSVADAGGWTRVATPVDRILIENGKAVGVALSDGEIIRSKRVISAANVGTTIRQLLPPEVVSRDWARSIKALRPASAHVCLYLGFKGDIRSAGATAANKWFYDTWNCERDVWEVEPARDSQPPADILYCSFPSLKDPSHEPGPEQRHTGEVVTFVPWETFAPWREQRWKKRGADYNELKAKLEERLLEQLLVKMPGLKSMVDYVELSTPVSTDHFCRPVAGSIYGLEPTPERFACPWLRPRSPIENLFFAGSDVATVGVIGAMMGGLLSALSAEPLAGARFLRPLF